MTADLVPAPVPQTERIRALAADLAMRVQDQSDQMIADDVALLPLGDVAALVIALARLVRLDLPADPSAGWRETDLCSAGKHAMTGRNTRLEYGRWRRCRACDRDRAHARRARLANNRRRLAAQRAAAGTS